MYIPMFFIIVGLIIYIVYSTYINHKRRAIIADLIRSYDQITLHLISYYIHSFDGNKKKQRLAAEYCAKAVIEAAGQTVTTQSFMGTTDILSMCRVFRRSFTMREKLTPPDYEFSPKYDKELKLIQDEVANDICYWFGINK